MLQHERTGFIHAFVYSVSFVALVGCAQLPESTSAVESSAFADYRSTTLGASFAEGEDAHPGESAFALIKNGDQALAARLALIDSAEQAVDVQVYIWEPDETGLLMAERLVRAANRGVRVRVLVDDLGFGGDDAGIAAFDAHPNIEARLFNPFANRGFSMADFLFDLNRVNHRMHNKMLIADNSIAVVGGRNIGNHYFDSDPSSNFRDLDIGAIGPVVREASQVFDHFWNGDDAIPVVDIVEQAADINDATTMIANVREQLAQAETTGIADDNVIALSKVIHEDWQRWPWARGRIVWNRPDTVAESGATGEILIALRQRLDSVQHTLNIESAYFVVRDGGVERLGSLTARGVKVRVLTNSLLSNDVLAAHAGHAKYREKLLAAGVEVYELRADSNVIKSKLGGESRAGLHTKAITFDNEASFVGSFNLDPRSANINTEAGIYVESETIAADLNAYMVEGASLKNSYRRSLDEDGDLLWTTEIDGETVTYDEDPLSTFGQRFTTGFIKLLPIASQL